MYKVGDLIRFGYINGHTGHLNRKTGVYLGSFPNPAANVFSEKILMIGESTPRYIDARLITYAEVVK